MINKEEIKNKQLYAFKPKIKNITVNMPLTLPSTAISYSTVPTNIEIGGATIIVTDVARFEHF